MFRSLRVANYRWWFIAALVSNAGAWMQRTAQDWIVLTELTDGDAVALGISTALQFGPMLLFTPVGGALADRFDKRTVILVTQSAQALLAIGLGVLVITGAAELWHLYLFAFLLGVATSLDFPARQTFIAELVEAEYLSNAVALNTMSFQGARLVGPAIAGILIAVVGAGPVFFINAGSFAAVILVLFIIRRSRMQCISKPPAGPGKFVEGLRYIRARGDLLIVLMIVFLVGSFGLNLPIFVATMATEEFAGGATTFGILNSVMAVGAIAGSLFAASQRTARLGTVAVGAFAFAAACTFMALAPDIWTFGIALCLVGAASLSMITTANAYIQVSSAPVMRGRVLGIYMAIFAGATPIGAPVIGAVSNTFGPRWSIAIAVLAGLTASTIALIWLISRRGMRLIRTREVRFPFRLSFAAAGFDPAVETTEITLPHAAESRKPSRRE